MGASGRRSGRSRRRSGAAVRRLAQPGAAGRAGRRGPARAPTEERERIRAPEREVRDLRRGLPGLDRGPTRSRARRRRVSRRRSSTARRSDDPVHRRAPRRPRGRADTPTGSGHGVCRLPPIAPSTQPRACGRAARPERALCPAAPRRRAARPETARVHAETFGLSRGAQETAAAQPRGRRGRPVHRGAADAGHGAAGRGAGRARAHHRARRGAAMPARPGEAPAPRARAGSVVGERPHPRGDLGGLRPHSLRHRRLRAARRGPGG
jgi:hypothetical protein